MTNPPARSEPAEGPLDALSKRGTGQVRALAAGIGKESRGIVRRKLGQCPVQGRGELCRGRLFLGRRRGAFPFRQSVRGLLAPPAGLCSLRPHLPCDDSQDPRESVAAGIELARAAEDPKKRLLRDVVGLFGGEEAPREAAQEWPEPPEERIERRALAAREGRQLFLNGETSGRVHPRPLDLTSSSGSVRSRSGRRSPACRPGSRSADCSCDSPPTPSPATEPPPSEPPASSTSA